MYKSGLKVYAPASVANVAVGFDILGFAIEKPGDEIIIKHGKQPGLVITKITGDKKKLPYDLQKNTAGYAALKYLEHIGESERPLEMEIHKKMPFGSGLGSSAASAVAGVYGVNAFLGAPLEKKDLLPFAVLGEQVADGAYHADNVAPSLLGGMVMVRNKTLDFVKIPIPYGIYVSAIYPHISVLTKDSRSVLSEDLKLKTHIEQSSHLGFFLSGMYTSNFKMIGDSLKDLVIEPQRAQLIPHFYEMKELAMNDGALGFSISGAGPTVFGLFDNSLNCENASQKISALLTNKGIENTVYNSKINLEGAIKF